ncbi:branched-chain amino acid ABC transporter permease [Ramlibacter henchirensis]|uniref:Branched-chain amino acid ABC transporter permease n=1 Tax=Ramlibacter henchirensis TaxID=204072 RepID=A0A4Z0BVM7_9BURK|nr:branched-chain amino acid ABC transporter permease [Ramlibacter henchirensis]TFZ02931.1 branched-chain amino acid ABC transporter permease [Ramlibacter henchirensis]
MGTLIGIPLQAFLSQLLVGLINGSMYALLSLGLAVIFGMLRVVNFAHGAFYMVGAFAAWMLQQYLELGYWIGLVVAPLLVAALAMLVERSMLARLYRLDALYGMLFTFGLALAVEGLFFEWFGTGGQFYPVPEQLAKSVDLGFMVLPLYRAWVVVVSLVVSLGVWLLIEKTRIGAQLRASTHNPGLVQIFGINVPMLMTLTFALGVALAAFGGVLSAPLFQATPLMGQNIIIIVFAVVVIGGMGSIRGAIVTGYALGLCEAVAKIVYPQGAGMTVFVLMVLVLLLRPQGLFGGGVPAAAASHEEVHRHSASPRAQLAIAGATLLAFAVLPWVIYPVAAMNILCFALFSAAFNLLLGYVGMVSFGHAAFFGGAAYVTAYSLKTWGVTAEVALVLSVTFAALQGLVIGYLAIRRKGIYFAMITLALAQMFYFICLQVPATGGDDGIQGVPPARLFGVLVLDDPTVKYYVVAAAVVLGLGIVWRVVHSPFGYVLQAIRDNEPRAISLGYRVDRYKLGAFVISSALAGLAGGLKAIAFQFASLADVAWQTSGVAILTTLIGGIGTMLGPIIGSALIVGLERFLATSGYPVHVVLGVVFMLAVLAFRRGIVGFARPMFKRASPGAGGEPNTPDVAKHS